MIATSLPPSHRIKLQQPQKIGAAVERVMRKYHGYRDFDWKLTGGVLEFSESEPRLGREKQIEGKYVVMTSENGLSVLDAIALDKELSEVESGFRQLKNVMAMRPIYHQIEARVKAHILLAALALLVLRLLGRRHKEAGVVLSPARAMQALATVRLVTFRLEGRAARRGVSGGCRDARLVLIEALKLVDHRPPEPPGEEDMVTE